MFAWLIMAFIQHFGSCFTMYDKSSQMISLKINIWECLLQTNVNYLSLISGVIRNRINIASHFKFCFLASILDPRLAFFPWATYFRVWEFGSLINKQLLVTWSSHIQLRGFSRVQNTHILQVCSWILLIQVFQCWGKGNFHLAIKWMLWLIIPNIPFVFSRHIIIKIVLRAT